MPGFQALDLVGDALRLVARHFRAFVATQGLFVLLGGLVSVVIAYFLVTNLFGVLGAAMDAPPDADPAVVMRAFGAAMLQPLLALQVTALLTMVGAFFGLGLTAQLPQEEPGLGALWARFGPRFGAVFGALFVASFVPGFVLMLPVLVLFAGGAAGLLSSVYVAMALFVLAVPLALWLYLRWWLAPPAALLGQGSLGDALRDGAALARGRLVGILAVVFVLGILNGIVTSVLGAPFAVAFGPAYGTAPDALPAQPSITGVLLQGLMGVLASLFFAPAHTAASMLAYRRLTAPAPDPGPAPPVAAPSMPPATAGEPGGAPALSCTRCGAAAKPGAAFCHVCGTTLGPR